VKTSEAEALGDDGPRSGFTIIEIMAVVLILALTMTLLLPAIGAGGGGALRTQAFGVVGSLELARQRAVTTGKPHRVVIDLENGAYFIEWLVTEARANGENPEPPTEPNAAVGSPDGGIDLTPPRNELAEYFPIPNRFGGPEWLGDGFFFEGVDTPEGWIESGEVFIVFAWDGSSDAAQIVLSDPDNRSIDLDVLPMLDTVRIHEED
jgi:prepilin-type N-terminal cleavage/methylation domain-containing protein